MNYCKSNFHAHACLIPENLSAPISLEDNHQLIQPLTLAQEVEHASDGDVVDGELVGVAVVDDVAAVVVC